MRRQVVHTLKVPPARVPLSQAIKIGDWVFASGQLGLGVRTGRLAEGGIAAETRQVCENLKAVLEAAGSSLDRMVKVTIYMVDLRELMDMNNVFSEYFPIDPPAPTTFQCAALLGGARLSRDHYLFRDEPDRAPDWCHSRVWRRLLRCAAQRMGFAAARRTA